MQGEVVQVIRAPHLREACEMQSAETVLGVLRERGRRGLPLERLYRQLFNPRLYLLAYRKLYSNAGAMTPGATRETVDGMSLAKIGLIIGMVRRERWRWSPVKRIYIPKRNGKQRPLGLPTWSDKLLAEVVRMLLNAYYDVQFSDHSHGFRPGRGCHTALQEIADVWKGTNWFVEGDVTRCFDSPDHEILLRILGEKIHDGRFLRLVEGMLKAGYLEDWRWGATLSGAPQGGIASPVLSNIYLDRLDRYVETQLLPLFNRGRRRAPNLAYEKISAAIRNARRDGDQAAVRALILQRRALPSKDPYDPGYRRLRYVRYCDDFLLGFSGPKAEAVEIKQKLGTFLREELKLELSEEKTLVTHARTGKARFLGYDIVTWHANDKLTSGKRSINGGVGLRVPEEAITRRCAPYMRQGKPWHRPQMLSDRDYSIISQYQAEYRGVVQYYLLAAVSIHGVVTGMPSGSWFPGAGLSGAGLGEGLGFYGGGFLVRQKGCPAGSVKTRHRSPPGWDCGLAAPSSSSRASASSRSSTAKSRWSCCGTLWPGQLGAW
jgi:group II intron reverse transcriptase/maturase